MRTDDVDGGPIEDVGAVAVAPEPTPMTGNAAAMIHNARTHNHRFMQGANRAQKRAQWKHYKKNTTVDDVRVEIANKLQAGARKGAAKDNE